jgi:hypothetical protein
MSWAVTGGRAGTVLAVSEAGLPICHGEAQHEPNPPGLNDYGGNINRSLLRQLQESKCAWTIASTGESPLHIDANGEGLIERISQAPTRSHGMVKFFSDPDLVAVVSVVPPSALIHIRRIFELVLLSDSLCYSIVFNFLGFRAPHATTNTPTWEEFMAGKPHFFNEIAVALRTNDA